MSNLYLPMRKPLWDITYSLGNTRHFKYDVLAPNEFVNTSNVLKIIKNHSQQNSVLEDPLSYLNASVQKTFLFILNTAQELKKTDFTIDPNVYFKARGIKRSTKNIINLIEDLKLLSHCELDISQSKHYKGILLSHKLVYNQPKPNSNKRILLEIQVNVGNWLKPFIGKNPYTTIHAHILKYNPKRLPYVIPLSLKLAERYRNNMKNRGERKGKEKLNIKSLVRHLGITNDDFRRYGFSHERGISTKLVSSLLAISENEGYAIHFSNNVNITGYRHTNKREFLDDYIIFEKN